MIALEIPQPRRSKRGKRLKRMEFVIGDKRRPDLCLIYEQDGNEIREVLSWEEWRARAHRYSAGMGLRK